MLMDGRGRGGVSGLEQGFGHETQHVIVLGQIEEAVAVTTNRDEAGEAQLGEMLGDCGRCDTDVFGEVVDRVLTMQQRPHDVQPRSISEQLQSLCRRVEFCPCRFGIYPRSHADSVLVLARISLCGEARRVLV